MSISRNTKSTPPSRIRQEAAYRVAGLIESALETGQPEETLMEHGWTEQDAKRIIQQMQRIADRLKKQSEENTNNAQ